MSSNNSVGTQIDFDRCILWGDRLRILLKSPEISYGEINELLREKGIFVDSADKSVTVPLLSSCILTPSEFKRLIERSFSRESLEKKKNYTLPIKTKDADILTAVAENFDEWLGEISLDDGLEFTEKPNVTVIDEDKVLITYKIKKTDFSQDWIEQEIIYGAQLVVSKNKNGVHIDLASTHTSKDTDKINKKIVSLTSKRLFEEGITTDTKAKTIQFDEFTNSERVRFFLLLTGANEPNFKFNDFIDLEIIRDDTTGPLPKEPDIQWMEGKVKRIKIDGNNLDKISFIKEKKYHNYYFMVKINVTFKYAFGIKSGLCSVCFSFSGRASKNDDYSGTEFSFSISKVQNSYKSGMKELKEFIETELRNLQEKCHREIIEKRTIQTEISNATVESK